MTSFNPSYLSKVSPPKTVTLEVRASTWIWKGHKHSVHDYQWHLSPTFKNIPRSRHFSQSPYWSKSPSSLPWTIAVTLHWSPSSCSFSRFSQNDLLKTNQMLVLFCLQPFNASHHVQNTRHLSGLWSQPIPLATLLTALCQSDLPASPQTGLCISADSAGNALLPLPCAADFSGVSVPCRFLRRAFPDHPLAARPGNSNLSPGLVFLQVRISAWHSKLFVFVSLPGSSPGRHTFLIHCSILST